MGHQCAGLVPPQLLAGQPAGPLQEAPFHLPQIDGGVKGLPHIVQDVNSQQLVFAGQGVQQNLRDRRAVGEIEKRAAPEGLGVVGYLGGAVIACGGQGNPRQIGLINQLGEVDEGLPHPHPGGREADLLRRRAVSLRREFRQPPLDLAGGQPRRHAIEVAAGGGRRGRGVRHLAGVGGGASHLVQAYLKLSSHHLGHLGVKPLPHFGAAMVQQRGAVAIDMEQRAGLVVEGGGEGDPELDRRQGQAAL